MLLPERISTVFLNYCVLVLLLTDVFLEIYVYYINEDFQQVYVDEITSDAWKKQIRIFLNESNECNNEDGNNIKVFVDYPDINSQIPVIRRKRGNNPFQDAIDDMQRRLFNRLVTDLPGARPEMKDVEDGAYYEIMKRLSQNPITQGWPSCLMIIVLLTQIYLTLNDVYKIKFALPQQLFKKERNEALKEQVQQILNRTSVNIHQFDDRTGTKVKRSKETLKLDQTSIAKCSNKRRRRQTVGVENLSFVELLTLLGQRNSAFQQYLAQRQGPGAMGLPGPPGGVGPQGFQGAPGAMGINGGPGPMGATGPIGATGASGPKGEPGVGLIGPAGANGNQGLTGVPGMPGPKGEMGSSGLAGSPGVTGVTGAAGIAGGVGPAGIPGLVGPQGVKGDVGPTGLPGREGSIGPPGVQGLQGLPGPNGPTGANGDVGSPGLLGPSGVKGEIGKLGAKGDRGFPGIAGPPGAIGIPASPGNEGPRGFPGNKGDLGPNGLPGTQGIKGERGDRGPNGEQGKIGATGATGTKGESGVGLPGAPGTKGNVGLTGEIGPPGPMGKTGMQGAPGLIGPKGDMGKIGLTGAKGDRGLPGLTGKQGPKGSPGPPGLKGAPGQKGQCQFSMDEIRFNLKVTKYGNGQYSGLQPRKTDCVIIAIKSSESYGDSNAPHGALMVDSHPLSNADAQKIWITVENNYTLFEYSDMRSVVVNSLARSYELYAGFRGNAHVIYKGALFHQTIQSKPRMIKFYLNSQASKVLDIPELTAENTKPLYREGRNYLDFSVDENGLWVIFAVPDTSNTAVMKVDTDNMTIQNIWNITLDHQIFDEMFIASGVLYAIDSIIKTSPKIRFAFDLYRNKFIYVDLNNFSEFDKLSMMTYDYRNEQVLIWISKKNGGVRMSYPVVCEERGNVDAE